MQNFKQIDRVENVLHHKYQSSLTWSRDAFWANLLPNQSTPKTVLALQHPINLLLVDRFTWNLVWVSFNHLVISIQRYNEFGVKMTVSEPLTWGPFFSGHSVPPFLANGGTCPQRRILCHCVYRTWLYYWFSSLHLKLPRATSLQFDHP